MKTPLLARIWTAFRQALGRVARAALIGLVAGFVLVELLATALYHLAGSPAGLTLGWPPAVSVAPETAFVHIMAAVFAVTIAYLAGFTVAVSQTVRGLVFAAEHVDDAVGAVASGGLNLADAVVDAVDGPNRHGFLGRRGPAAS